MDKNTIIGLVLIAALLMGYSFYAQETMPQQPAQTTPAVTEADVTQQTKDDAKSLVKATVMDSTALFFNCRTAGKDSLVAIENEKLRVELNTKGGMVANVYLKEYKEGTQEYRYRSYDDFHKDINEPLHLYRQKDASMSFTFDTKGSAFNTSDYDFQPVNLTDSSVTMRLMSVDGATTFDVVYRLQPNNYMLDFDIQTQGLDKYVSTTTNQMTLNWEDRVSQLEKGFNFENQHSALTYKVFDDDTEKLGEMNSEKITEFDGPITWVAFKNQYFSSVLIAENPFSAKSLGSHLYTKGNKDGYLKEYKANLLTGLDVTGKEVAKYQFYFGPNQFRLLQSMDEHAIGGEQDLELEELVYLGWPLFRWINRFFTLYIFDFFTRMGLPMGIVLLLITILLRVIVYLPTKKSFMSSAKMRVLKPKIDEIAKKYPNKEDAMKRQQETMSLYSQYGASPMGGCLPMLIQMPIWIAMFNFVPNALELRQQGFLWAEDLSTYDSIISWDKDLWLIGDHLSLFCILFCATNIIYSFMTMRQQQESMSSEQAEQMKMMRWMMYLMPVFFFFMFNDYSSGLNYYYFISLLASALTMWYLRRSTDDAKLLAKLEANFQANKNNPNRKTSGLAARLEALQKQQQAMLEEQQRRRQQK